MGSGRLLVVYLAAWLMVLASPFLRRRLLLVPGTHLASLHLLVASAMLFDAALFSPDGPAPVFPLLVVLVLAGASRVFRDTWLLLGPRQERAMRLLEECCARNGISLDRSRERLVLKRQGTSVARTSLLRGVSLLRWDRRRRELEVDRLGKEWGRALSAAGESG